MVPQVSVVTGRVHCFQDCWEKNTWCIVDFAIPMDHHVKEKEEQKNDKYMNLAAEVRRQFRVRTVIVSVVLGALGTIPAKLSKLLEILKIEDVIGSLQTSLLISATAIFRRVFKFLRSGSGLEVNKYPFTV